MAAPASVVVLAPAKVNLTLQVIGRRVDGYHELVSWVAPLDLCDELIIDASAGEGVALSCDSPGLESGRSNLVVRAAEALAREAGVEPRLRIQLRKRIPIAAGLGGGSSDAAATIVALNRLWRLGWSRDRLAEIGAEIGSDVALFVIGMPCVIRGRGERVEPLRRGRQGAIVLFLPPFGVSTASVYDALGPQDLGERPDPRRLMHLNAVELSGQLFNELEAAACRIEPRLDALRARLERCLERPVRMSGSGSALFAIFDDLDSANRCRQRIDASDSGEFEIRVCSTWFSEPETA